MAPGAMRATTPDAASPGSHPKWRPAPRWRRKLRLKALIVIILGILCHRYLQKPSRRSTDLSMPNSNGHAWGSLIGPYHLHAGATKESLTIKALPKEGLIEKRDQPLRILIVTTELAGVHKNGGIGTAFLELALLLAKVESFRVSVLIAQYRQKFARVLVEEESLKLQRQGIELLFLPPLKTPFWPYSWVSVTSYEVLQYLSLAPVPYDIVHFPDNSGLGYYSMLAKLQGWALASTHFITGLHGPDVQWAALLNKRYPSTDFALELDWYERKTVELADTIVSPSAYMLDFLDSRGWKVPEERFVVRNALAQTLSAVQIEGKPLTELVFFGRLETRKGFGIFLDSITRLIKQQDPGVKYLRNVTLMGRMSLSASEKVHFSEVVASWKLLSPTPFDVTVLSEYGREAAFDYLSKPGRLVVIPSLNDNLPYTIMECLVLQLRFIASAVGGIPELIAPEDRDRILFRPTVRSLTSALSAQLRNRQTTWNHARASFTLETINHDWIALHHAIGAKTRSGTRTARKRSPRVSIAIIHHERPQFLPQAIESVYRQTYRNFDLVVLDDGSTQPATIQALAKIEEELLAPRGHRIVRIENSYLGEARNQAAKHMHGEYLFFTDDDDVLKPGYIERLVDIAAATKVDVLSSFLDEFKGPEQPLNATSLEDRRIFAFTGQDLSLGLMRNCFGSGNIFVSRTCFDKIGGFSSYQEGIGAEDWEFYIRVALANCSHQVVPEPLIFTRSDFGNTQNMKFVMDPWMSDFRALTPLLDDHRVQSTGLTNLLMFARGSSMKVEDTLEAIDTDLVKDFSGIQGHKGWNYSFRNASDFFGPLPTSAVYFEGRWYAADTDNSWPYIEVNSQHPGTTTSMGSIAATRTYTFNEESHVVIAGRIIASHSCGDGTAAQIILERPDQPPTTLLSIRTLDDPETAFQKPLFAPALSQIHIAIFPLGNDACDAVWVEAEIKHSDNMLKPAASKSSLESLRAASSRVITESGAAWWSQTPSLAGHWTYVFRNRSGGSEQPAELHSARNDSVRRVAVDRDVPFIAWDAQHSSSDLDVIRRFHLANHSATAAAQPLQVKFTARSPAEKCDSFCGDGTLLSVIVNEKPIWVHNTSMGEQISHEFRLDLRPGSVLEWKQESGANDWYDNLFLSIQINRIFT